MTIDNPSDTPNTEAEVFTHTRLRDGVIVGEQEVVDADFARGLERELASARREAEGALRHVEHELMVARRAADWERGRVSAMAKELRETACAANNTTTDNALTMKAAFADMRMELDAVRQERGELLRRVARLRAGLNAANAALHDAFDPKGASP